jgi:hypothetical protein
LLSPYFPGPKTAAPGPPTVRANRLNCLVILERAMGFEPTTPTLAR